MANLFYNVVRKIRFHGAILFRPDDAALGRRVPWAMHPLNDSSFRRCVPDRCVLTLWESLTVCCVRLGMTCRGRSRACFKVGHLTLPKMTCHDKYVDGVQGQDTLVRDTLSKGCIVQGTRCPRDGTSETFGSRGTRNRFHS